MLCIGCTESSDKYNLEYDGGYFVDTNGEKLYMINNPNATDPTYDELAVFLKDDVTEDMDEEYPDGSSLIEAYCRKNNKLIEEAYELIMLRKTDLNKSIDKAIYYYLYTFPSYAREEAEGGTLQDGISHAGF